MHAMDRLFVFNALLLLAVAAIPVKSTALPEVSTFPSEDQYVASMSDEDVVYTCTTKPLGNATATWELNGTQLNTEALRQHVEGLGIYIYSESASETTINFTRRARTEVRRVQCVGSVDGTNSEKGKIFHVRSFDSPLQPLNVRLEPGGNGAQLQWDRPKNVLVQVETIYTVNITSVQDGSIVYDNTTTESSLPLRLVEDHIGGRECGLYQISVYAINDAGRGLISEPVIQTIPQSPSVSNLSQSLTVETVTLGSLSAVISFAEAEVCSENFTLTNYSVVIDGRIVLPVDADKISPSPSDKRLRLELNESIVQDEFLPGCMYEVAVRACTAVTCRTSTTVVLNTTHTQQVDILMFEDRLFVRCTFADQSDALGCNVRFSDSDGNETALLQVSREKEYLCNRNRTNYRLREYSNVTVNDLRANGTEGDTTFYIIPREIDTLDEFFDITQCPRDPTPISTGIIIAIVVCTVIALAIALVAVIAIVAIVYICVKKSQGHEIHLDKTYSMNTSRCSKTPLQEADVTADKSSPPSLPPSRQTSMMSSIRMSSFDSEKQVEFGAERRMGCDGAETPTTTDQPRILEETDGLGDTTADSEGAGLIKCESQPTSHQQEAGVAEQRAVKRKDSEQKAGKKQKADDEKPKVLKTDSNMTIATREGNLVTVKATEMASFFGIDMAKLKLKFE